ncbi:MAG: Mrp/NBP35 family ATP-binding protein [candidate division KSB1 bacterium]|nr:Mrp/NBP35 family ATP-binding protein [candidate division KSB1 bacterium]
MNQNENLDQALEQIDLEKNLNRIKYKILVLSGKGGVGKSTVSANLALSLALNGNKVGLLDVDFHGPSIPRLMGLEGRQVDMKNDKLVPVNFSENLKVLSLGMLVQSRDAVIWRGPMKMGAIKQMLKDVEWGDLDYLIFDSPPGTGDEPLSVVQLVKNATGAVVVTTPQALSTSDVRRSIQFCEKLNLPVLGVIENMSGFVCPSCGATHDIFKTGGGESMSREMNVAFLGKIPIEPQIVQASDEGKPYVYHYGKSETAQSFLSIVEQLVEKIKGAKT